MEERFDELARAQTVAAEAMKSQQRDIGGLHQAVADVVKNQEWLNARVLTVQRDIGGQRKAVRHEVQSVTRLLMSRAADEREQLQAELQSLSTANDALSREVENLKHRNQELKSRLKSAGIDVSQAVPAPGGPAGPPPTAPPSTEMAPSHPSEAFTFSASFHDGVTEESIEHLVKALHGRRSSAKFGWTKSKSRCRVRSRPLLCWILSSRTRSFELWRSARAWSPFDSLAIRPAAGDRTGHAGRAAREGTGIRYGACGSSRCRRNRKALSRPGPDQVDSRT